MPDFRHFCLPDRDALRRDVRNASGLERVNIQRLYDCLKPDPDRPPREVYDLHWPMVYLLEQTPEAREQARRAVLVEALEGGPKNRRGHAWDRQNFFEMHLWISAAMAAHIAIAMDWLAVEGALSREEIDTMGEHFVDGFWRYIYPHLKGKGRAPFFHDPINQDSAMVAGCLVIGHLFGDKWARDDRARRMYADALAHAGNLLWQSSPSGFDGDGFTYMRLIQPPVLTLIAMVIEEVEGEDFFFEPFGPGRCSVASFMDHLQQFTLPSGYSFPHGRYGYVTIWNQYSQAYAARKTGDPRYLERILSMDQRNFITPWIAMDLPLAVAWAPYGAAPGAPKQPLEPQYRTWHDPALWSNIGEAEAKIQAHLCWRAGAGGSFILEHDRRRFVLLTGERHGQTNGISFDELHLTGKSGRDFEHLETAGVTIDKVQLRDQWSGGVIEDHTRYCIVQGDGVCIAVDRFSASREVAATYGLSLPSAIDRGRVRSEDAGGAEAQLMCGIDLQFSQCAWGKQKQPYTRAAGALPRSTAGFAATLFNFGDSPVRSFESTADGLRWESDAGGGALSLNPRYPGIRDAGDGRTDAILRLESEESRVFFSVKRYASAQRRIWATTRVNMSHCGDTITIDRLAYGSFCRYVAGTLDIAIACGSGYDIYVSTSRPLTVELPRLSENPVVQVNGERRRATVGKDTITAVISPTDAQTAAWSPPAAEALMSEEAANEALSALDALLCRHASTHLGLARRLLDHPRGAVRLAAAEALGFLGDEADALAIARRLRIEASLVSELNGLDAPWHGKWEHFPSVANMADALRKLGNEETIDALREALPRQYEPHARGAIHMAIEALTPDTARSAVKEDVCV